MHILVNTRSGAEYLFTFDGCDGGRAKMARTDADGSVHYESGANPIEVFSTAVEGGRLEVPSIGLTRSSTIERVLRPIGFASTPYSQDLPMVTNRCACGRIVDLLDDEETRDWHPTRVNGNSHYGYEPYCQAHAEE